MRRLLREHLEVGLGLGIIAAFGAGALLIGCGVVALNLISPPTNSDEPHRFME
jgi:hypothetical protein